MLLQLGVQRVFVEGANAVFHASIIAGDARA